MSSEAFLRDLVQDERRLRKLVRRYWISMRDGTLCDVLPDMLPPGLPDILPCPYGDRAAERPLTLIRLDPNSKEHEEQFCDVFAAGYQTNPLVEAMNIRDESLHVLARNWLATWRLANVGGYAVVDAKTGEFLAVSACEDWALANGTGRAPTPGNAERFAALPVEQQNAITIWRRHSAMTKKDLYEKFAFLHPDKCEPGEICTAFVVMKRCIQGRAIGAILSFLMGAESTHRGYKVGFARPSNPASVAFSPNTCNERTLVCHNEKMGDYLDPILQVAPFAEFPKLRDLRPKAFAFLMAPSHKFAEEFARAFASLPEMPAHVQQRDGVKGIFRVANKSAL